MSSTALRHQRLLALLPRVYASQPENSYVGRVLGLMASTLGEYDDAMRRVLYDRWLVLATGSRIDEASLSALGHLGSLLGIYRLPPRIEHSNFSHEEAKATEDKNALPVLTIHFKSGQQRRDALFDLIGETTPAEISTRLAALFPTLNFDATQDDTLIVRLKPITEPDSTPDEGQEDAPEPDYELTIFQSMLEWEPPELYRQRLRITAGVLVNGLVTPRAILSLAIADAGAWPCPKIQRNTVSDAARERGIPADSYTAYGIPPAQASQCQACHDPTLPCPLSSKLDEQRLIHAQLLENPVLPAEKQFSGDTRNGAVLTLYNDSLWSDRPEIHLKLLEKLEQHTKLSITSELTGTALVICSSEDWAAQTEVKVSPQLSPEELVPFESGEKVTHHAWNTSHGQAALRKPGDPNYHPLDATYFLDGLHTPRLHSGENTWNITALKDEKPVSLRFELSLHWFIRRPFHFRLSLPKTDALKQAEMRGALPLIQYDLERIRAVGVRTDLRFPEAPRREVHELKEILESVEFTLRVDDLNLQEAAKPLALDATVSLSESLNPGDTPVRIDSRIAFSERHELREKADPFTVTVSRQWSEPHRLVDKPPQVHGQQTWVEKLTPREGKLWISAIFADDQNQGGTRFDESLFADDNG